MSKTYRVTAHKQVEQKFALLSEAVAFIEAMGAEGYDVSMDTWTMEPKLEPMEVLRTEYPGVLYNDTPAPAVYTSDKAPEVRFEAPVIPSPTEAEVRDAFRQWSQQHGVAKAKALLEQFGVQRFTDLVADQLGAFKAALA
jgi:hypothetical protein